MSKAVWLLIRGVEPDRWSHQIEPKRQTIGRSPDCDIQIPHKTVSRYHTEVWLKSNSLYVRDLKSLNGTFVSDVSITESAVPIGAELRIGRVKLDVVSDLNITHSSIINLDAGATNNSVTSVTFVDAKKQPNVNNLLTAGQRQVLEYLLQGMSEKMVASALSISRQTVHTHVKEIYRQMNVHSRPELMALFISSTLERPIRGRLDCDCECHGLRRVTVTA